MVLLVAALLTAGAVAFTLFIRATDIPQEADESPLQHLEDRKARIYEALRDLNFEFRVGKLSEEDYQKTKLGLQQDLARVMAQIDAGGEEAPEPTTVPAAAAAAAVPAAQPAAQPEQAASQCPHCGATFPQALKFCGECGKPIEGEVV